VNTAEHRALAGAFFTACLLFTGALLLTAGISQAERREASLQRCIAAGEPAGRCERISYGF
jgi:hypothetical protein